MQRFVDTSGPVTETWDFHGDDSFTVKRSMDVEPILRSVEAQRSMTGGRGETMHCIARIPDTVAAEYARLRGIELRDLIFNPAYAGELVRLAQHRDYRRFSPTEGKV